MQPQNHHPTYLSAWLLVWTWAQTLDLLQGIASLVLTAASLAYVLLQIREKLHKPTPHENPGKDA